MASLLFLAPDDLAETVLATGALASLVRSGDRLAISTKPEAATLFRVPPAPVQWLPSPLPIGRVLTGRFSGERFDTIIDARGDLAGRLIQTRARIELAPAVVVRHLAERWSEAVGATRTLPPALWIDDAARRGADAATEAEGPLLVLAPGGVEAGKRWPWERFAAAARRLGSGALNGARIVVLGAAARDAAITASVVRSLDADGVCARDLGTTPDLLMAAALMERATICIGNDNVLTHIAAAAGAPTLALFGPTDERVRAPYGPRVRTLRARSLEEIAAAPALDADAAMRDVSIDAVEAAALDLLHAGGLR